MKAQKNITGFTKKELKEVLKQMKKLFVRAEKLLNKEGDTLKN